MIPLLLILVVTSTGLANRQSPDGFSTAVRMGRTTPHGPPDEQCHMESQGHTRMDITCAHKSDAVCRFISSVAPSSVMHTRGGPDWFGIYMNSSLQFACMRLVAIIFAIVINVYIMSRFTPDRASVRLDGYENFFFYTLGVATMPIVKAIYSRYDKWWRQPTRMENTRSLIEADEYPYTYPVFVSTSSDIDDMLRRQVLVALEQQLQVACRTNRHLVCSADNIEPGRRLFSETTSFLEQSGMMVIVISDGYNECVWCEEELQQARMLHKPILIIQFGDVDLKTMNPILREIIRKYTPITMDEEYDIPHDWESVCNVILQLLPCRLDPNKTPMPLHYLLRPVLNLFNVIRQQY